MIKFIPACLRLSLEEQFLLELIRIRKNYEKLFQNKAGSKSIADAINKFMKKFE